MKLFIKCPSRNSWFRAILLIFSRVLVILLLLRLLESLPKGDLRTLASIGGWIGFSTLMGVWNHFISVSKGETKLWKVQTKSVTEVIDALKVSFLSDLTTIVSGLFLFFTLNYIFKLSKENAEILLGLIVLLMIVIWFFSIPLLYERALKKRKPKTKPKTKFIKR